MEYKAMDARGRMARGRIEAVNTADLESRLRRMNLDLVSFAEARINTRGGTGDRVRRRDLIGFTMQLEQLLTSGVPVMSALTDLRDSTANRGLQAVIAGLVEAIEGGKTLSDAMASYPSVFDAVFVNLVRAGELSGQVALVLASITENLKWQDEQASRLRRVMILPAIVGVAVLSSMTFLLVYLVPKLVTFMRNMGQELPFHTRLLIDTSNLMRDYWYLVIAVPVLLFIGTMAAARGSEKVRYFIDDLRLRVWLFGPVLRKALLARFATYFSLLYTAGIPVLDAIAVCSKLVGNRVIADALTRSAHQISEGASISEGFEYTGLFPPLVVRMLRVGESSGALDKALGSVSYFYERDVRESVERLQSLVGPALTMMVGLMVLWIVLSILVPIYDMITRIGI